MLAPSNTVGVGLFDDFSDTPFWGRRDFSNAMMKTDVKEKDGTYIMDIDLPGYAREDIKAELSDGYLTIAAKRRPLDPSEEGDDYIFRERYNGTCQRSFYVGDAITHEDVKAKFKHGILTIEIPKKDANQVEAKKYIAIEG